MVEARKVGRLSRALDLGSLVLILVGGALYVRAYLGMQQIRNRGERTFVRGTTEVFSEMKEYGRLRRLSNVALGLAAVGLIVGLSAAAHAHMIARRTQPD
jgi:hypothetical protein